jgi:hypothetical protein
MTSKRWQVTLHGKWGGMRSVTVTAATEATAKKRAREVAASHERVGNAYVA